MNEPLIDVIIAAYNGEAFISDCIASIKAQTYKNIAIIVIDDGSTDNTAQIVRELMLSDSSISLVQQPNGGVSAALNAGIKSSTAPLIAFLDADDLWHEQKLEKQLQTLQDTAAEICFCLLQEFQTFDNADEESTHRARKQPLRGYSKTAFLGHRHVFNKYGLFDENIRMGDFIEWLGRVNRAGAPVIMIEEVLTYRRVHSANTTRNADKNSYLHILKAHLDELRKTKQA